MANTAAWIGGNGVGLTWTTAGFTATNFNSLASGSCVVAATQIDNSTALDLYTDVSFSFTNGASATTASSYIVGYLLPLNQDATTYGDGTVSGATPPSAQYQVGAVNTGVIAATTGKIIGTMRGIVMPPGKFKFVIANQIGSAFSSSAAAVVSYVTYNENLNR